mmetsp:Transcript_8669/g.24692  ORF Transcript_8669/g.24692 Transcript_8669/m.24692 type:complete len:210 (-) Transcript_8669:859-1488(-)
MLAKYRGFGAFGAALVLLRACCPGRAESMPPCMERRCMIGRCLCLDQAFNSNCLDGARNPHAAAFLYALIDAVPKDRTARVEQICLISKSLRQTYEALHERDARNMTKLLEQVALVTDGYRALGHRVHRIGVTFYDVFMHAHVVRLQPRRRCRAEREVSARRARGGISRLGAPGRAQFPGKGGRRLRRASSACALSVAPRKCLSREHGH